MHIARYTPHVTHHHPPTMHHPPPTTHHPLHTTHQPPPTTQHQPPSTHHPPPTTHRPPPTAHCPPPTIHHPSPKRRMTHRSWTQVQYPAVRPTVLRTLPPLCGRLAPRCHHGGIRAALGNAGAPPETHFHGYARQPFGYPASVVHAAGRGPVAGEAAEGPVRAGSPEVFSCAQVVTRGQVADGVSLGVCCVTFGHISRGCGLCHGTRTGNS